MKGGLLIICVALLLTAQSGWAEPAKKGRVLCEGDGCRSIGSVSGSLVGEAWDAALELKDRVTKRIEGGVPQNSKSVKGLKHKARKASYGRSRQDQIHFSAAASTSGEEPSNLPSYYAGVDRARIEASEKVVFVPKSHDPRLKGLKPGDVVRAVVEQQITASPETPTPVRAIATSGPFKGGYFVGEATLERELKRVLFKFTKLRLKSSDSVYSLTASGLSPRGSVGIEGEYVSQTGQFFFAELASAAAAGFVDATIDRNQTALGTYVQEPSLANSGKTASVTALSKTADRMAEIVRQAPEYTHVPGYQEIQVMIEEDPVESGPL